jgi:N-acetylmuramoyl-L-alanine amidase
MGKAVFKKITVFAGFLLWVIASNASAQELRALARVDAGQSSIADLSYRELEVTLKLSQPVPYRIFALTEPNRIVFDFKEVDWAGFQGSKVLMTEKVKELRFGAFQAGWSRMVIELSEPMMLSEVEMRTGSETGDAVLDARFKLVSPEEFAAQAGPRRDAGWDLPEPIDIIAPKLRQVGDRPIIVVLDPGHGGIDSGARRQGLLEKDMVMRFARELKESLILTGRYKAYLTRDDDSFISLPGRISKARSLGADLFISLHADTLESGWATGTTVYTLSDEASNDASALLAARQDREDLLAGVDLNRQSDAVATTLMEMARVETKSRSDLLAEMVVSGVAQSIGRLRKRPHLYAGFSVLKAPDIPSILVELGFMSNERDLNNLQNADWRDQVIKGIVLALDTWSVEDAAQAQFLRQ